MPEVRDRPPDTANTPLSIATPVLLSVRASLLYVTCVVAPERATAVATVSQASLVAAFS